MSYVQILDKRAVWKKFFRQKLSHFTAFNIYI